MMRGALLTVLGLLGTAQANAESRFSFEGEARVRYEALQGQFRAGGEGGDQLLLFRTLLHGKAEFGSMTLGVELQDSRTYLGDDGTPLSSSIANPLDVLQAYAAFDLSQLSGDGSKTSLKLGRQTVSIGSKRQIERVDFANVIKSYTGGHLKSVSARGDEFHLLTVVPTARFPKDKDSLFDNDLSGDEEQWGRVIWGAHYRRSDILPDVAPDLWGELFVYGLSETDRDDAETPNRKIIGPGFRFYRKPNASRWDMDVEGVYRFGTRHATSNRADTEDLDVSASMLWAAFGYTFDMPWQPRFAFEYYWASGDDDPNDDEYGRYERLFGSRRSDLNNTSIHGPLTPSNLNAPGFRIEVKPNDRWDGRFYYSAAHLAAEEDTWIIAKLTDPTGQSGSFVGHTLDARARYWVIPNKVRAEIGASALINGEFADNVPNGTDGDGTLFGYGQVTWQF